MDSGERVNIVGLTGQIQACVGACGCKAMKAGLLCVGQVARAPAAACKSIASNRADQTVGHSLVGLIQDLRL